MAEIITKILVFKNFRVREQVFIVIKLNYRTKIIDCRLYFSFVFISDITKRVRMYILDSHVQSFQWRPNTRAHFTIKHVIWQMKFCGQCIIQFTIFCVEFDFAFALSVSSWWGPYSPTHLLYIKRSSTDESYPATITMDLCLSYSNYCHR